MYNLDGPNVITRALKVAEETEEETESVGDVTTEGRSNAV